MTDNIAITTREQGDVWAKAVMADAKLSLGAKVTAMALRARLNWTTLRLNPSAERLSADTCQSSRAVQRHLKDLSDGHFIAWEGTKGRTSNKYCLILTTTLATWLEDSNHATSDVVKPNYDTSGTPTTTNGAINYDAGVVQTPVEPLKRTPVPSGGHALTIMDAQPSAKLQEVHSSTRGRRWGDGEHVPDEWCRDAEAACRALGLPVPDMAYEISRFENYWPSKPGHGGVKTNWHRTFINWITKAAKDGQGSGAKTRRPNSHTNHLEGWTRVPGFSDGGSEGVPRVAQRAIGHSQG